MREILRVQRLGKNHGGYHGETIDIRAVLQETVGTALRHGWTVEVFHEQEDFKWFALHRPAFPIPHPQPATRLYISAGIHGDEPAGPLAALKLIQQNRWPAGAEIFLLPCLNPAGFTLNQRANADGIDLNRDYRNPKAAETRAHISWLERQPQFDFYLCLHEDWEAHGFYVYELNPDARPSLAAAIIERVRPVCPIDLSPEIEGRPAAGGIIRPSHDPLSRPQWPEAFYLLSHQTRLCYTVEAPSDFPLPTRVAALVASVQAALELPP